MLHRVTVKFKRSDGYSLLELVCTLSVLAVLVVGTIPMAENAMKRQKEMRLREELRQIRNAIDEFKRDTYGACPQGAIVTGNPANLGGGGNAPTDARSRVVVDDCTIFDTSNLDRYPPSLQTLVDGVKVRARGINTRSGSGLASGSQQATELNDDPDLVKVYLRELPVDPFTGQADWKLRSSYQTADSDTWDNINVFDVRTSAEGEALNGEKYSDW